MCAAMLFCAFYRLLAVLYYALYATWSSLPASNVQWLLPLNSALSTTGQYYTVLKDILSPLHFMSKSIQGGVAFIIWRKGREKKLIEGCFLRSKKVSNQLRQFDVTWGEFDRSTAVFPFSCHSQYQTSLVQNVTVGISGRGRIWVKETSLAGRNTQKPQ